MYWSTILLRISRKENGPESIKSEKTENPVTSYFTKRLRTINLGSA